MWLSSRCRYLNSDSREAEAPAALRPGADGHRQSTARCGCFPCGTTALESIPSTPTVFFRFSSACTPGKSILAPASVWRSARKSLSGMEGRPWVEAQPGTGSNFRFTLPKAHGNGVEHGSTE